MAVYYAFEGIDGSGKDTQAAMLVAALGDAKLVTEPWEYGPHYAEIKDILRGAGDYSELPRLFFENRKEQLERHIAPMLAQGLDVVSSRSMFSAFVYQQDVMEAYKIRQMHSGLLKPNVLFWLDIPVSEAMRRIRKRGLARDQFEQRDRLTIMRARYRTLFKNCKWSATEVVKIDARGDVAMVAAQVREYIRGREI